MLGSTACLGCAGSARPSASAAPAVVVATEPVDVERRPYSEVMLPTATDATSPGIWVQVANVGQLFGKLPASVQSQPSLLPFKDLAPLVSGALGADVASIIDLSQPVDMATPMPHGFEGPSPVFAFRVRSPETIERGQAGLTLRPLAAGMWILGDEVPPPPAVEPDESAMDEEEEHPEDEQDEMPAEERGEPRMPCLLAHAPPPVGYRVLCGVGLEKIRALSAFLLRDTPAPVADVHVELGGPAYRALIDKALVDMKAESQKELETKTGGEKLGAEAGFAIVEALAAHERVGLDVRFGVGGAEALLDVAFPESPASELLQRWARSATERRLPAAFPLLPADDGLAFSFAGLGQETTRTFLAFVLEELLSDMSQEFVLSAQELRELQSSFAGVLPSDGHFSVALGADVDAIEKVLMSDAVRLADEAERPLTPAAIKALQAAMAGWVTVGFDLPPKDYLPAVERMLRANAIPMRRRPGMPRKDSEREDSHMRRRPVATRGLPAGTIHIVDEVRPAKTYRPPVNGSEPPVLPYDSHWLVVPDGQRVWIVGARSEALAGERALLAVQAKGKLAEQPAIRQTSARPLLGAWSFSLSGVRLQSLDWDSVRQRRAARREFKRSSKQLRGAKTPMLVTLELSPPPANGAPGFGFRARLEADQTALTELLDSSGPDVPAQL